MNGVVYAGFGSDCDTRPWQGWVFGVSTAGQVKARWVVRRRAAAAPASGSRAPGSPPTARGRSCSAPATAARPRRRRPAAPRRRTSASRSCACACRADGSLKAVDFFAPFDATSLDGWDADFASGGVTGLPEAVLRHVRASRISRSRSASTATCTCSTATASAASARDRRARTTSCSGIGPYGGVWSRPGRVARRRRLGLHPDGLRRQQRRRLVGQPARLPVRPVRHRARRRCRCRRPPPTRSASPPARPSSPPTARPPARRWCGSMWAPNGTGDRCAVARL